MNYTERLQAVIPGGAHTYSRGADQFPANAPEIFLRGKGAYLYDLQEKAILDYGLGLRSVNLGYADDRVNQAAIKQIEYGNNLTRPSLVELAAAETIVERIHSADMVKFAKNGSAVTTAAVKLARAYTGKTYILRCEQHPFFSYDDWFIGSTVIKRGIPQEIIQYTKTFKYDDLQNLEDRIAELNGDVACVIMEAATDSHPSSGYLNGVQRICEKHGIVFVLDEMITGFRWHEGGAQAYYGIDPDLSTFGKAMANGFSVAALVGKREIMDLGGISAEGSERLFLLSSTHGAEMSSLGAFVETLRILTSENVVERNWRFGEKLISGMNEVALNLGIEHHFRVTGVPCSPVFQTFDNELRPSLEFRTLFIEKMIDSGVLMPWIAISAAHGELELEKTLEATFDSLSVYKKALEVGVDKFLHSRPIKPVFREFN